MTAAAIAEIIAQLVQLGFTVAAEGRAATADERQKIVDALDAAYARADAAIDADIQARQGGT